MKTRFLPFLIALLALVACSDPQRKGPQETAKAFLDALAAGDYEGAKDFCTPGTRENLTMFQTFSGLGVNPLAGGFEITREDVDGDYATVYYNKEGSEHYVKLHKESGKWSVLANKADLNFDSDKDDSPKTSLFDSDEKKEDEGPDPADTYQADRQGKDAKQVAEAFLLAYAYHDIDKAKVYASKSTAEALDMQSGLSADEKGSTKFSITNIEERGEYASVYYKDKGAEQEKELKLGKDKHGNWEVIMTKSDFSAWKEEK